MTNVLAFCFVSDLREPQSNDQELPRPALETLAAARQLRDKWGAGEVQALLIGPRADAHPATLLHHGADRVLVASHSRLQSHAADVREPQSNEAALQATQAAVQRLSPAAVILPHNDLGAEVGARLAFRLKTGIVTDCVDLKVQGGQVFWLRPVYGGKATACMTTGGPLQLATIRSRAFEPLPADTGRHGAVETLDWPMDTALSGLSLVERVQEVATGISLDVAQTIVSGGRGIGDAESFAALKELAQVLGAAVAGSRPAADLGWVPHSNLVGQTGKIVAPNLYIAVGISGAPQHMAGAGSSKTIVAVNKDPDAPIFKVAHIGVVEEWQKVLPTLIQACKEGRGQ